MATDYGREFDFRQEQDFSILRSFQTDSGANPTHEMSTVGNAAGAKSWSVISI
jgi:hypothetical protein